MTRGSLVLLLLATTTLPGCFHMPLEQFDSVARWDVSGSEPAEVSYSDLPKQYPFFTWMFGFAATPSPVDSPSGFAREQMADLIRYLGGNLSRTAQVSRRLLWIMNKDPNPFNRIVAMQGIEQVLVLLGSDLLDPDAYYRETDPVAGSRREKVLAAAHARLETLFGRPDRPAISDQQRRTYLTAMREYVAEPLPRQRWQRDLIRTLWSITVAETDPAVRRAAREALRRAIYLASCNALRAALVPQVFAAVDLPAVRAEAIFVYRRLGGVPAVPFVLKLMARPQIGSLVQRYDQDPQVRMVLVRLCSQLRYEHVLRDFDGGPKPVEFLFETAVDEEEDESVRRVALEGLARCLNEKLGRRKIDTDLGWARKWWSDFIGGGRKGG